MVPPGYLDVLDNPKAADAGSLGQRRAAMIIRHVNLDLRTHRSTSCWLPPSENSSVWYLVLNQKRHDSRVPGRACKVKRGAAVLVADIGQPGHRQEGFFDNVHKPHAACFSQSQQRGMRLRKIQKKEKKKKEDKRKRGFKIIQRYSGACICSPPFPH